MNNLAKRVHVVSTFVELNIKVRAAVPPKKIGNWLSYRFQHLGPTYIKIGQFISSRSDIFGEEFTSEFLNLRDNVRPIQQRIMKPILQDLQDNYTFLKSIEEQPLASASIGQVHKAVDKNNKVILIKVRRPDITNTINQDIQFLRMLFSMASKASVENINNTVTMLDEFEAFLLQEINFDNERKNIVDFYETFMPEFRDEITIPRLIRCKERNDVILMEYINNIGFDGYTGDKSELAKSIMRFFIRQLVQYGVLHGDPHKGNIGITNDNKIVLYDYGNMIYLTNEERNILRELIYMLVIGNKYGVVKLLEKLGVIIDDRNAVYNYVDKYVEYMKTINVKVFSDLQKSNDKLPLHLTGKIIRIIRAYGILEGVCKELDANFNYFQLIDDKIADLAFDSQFLDYKVRKDIDALSKLQIMIFKLFDE